jgi:hypothetical protein
VGWSLLGHEPKPEWPHAVASTAYIEPLSERKKSFPIDLESLAPADLPTDPDQILWINQENEVKPDDEQPVRAWDVAVPVHGGTRSVGIYQAMQWNDGVPLQAGRPMRSAVDLARATALVDSLERYGLVNPDELARLKMLRDSLGIKEVELAELKHKYPMIDRAVSTGLATAVNDSLNEQLTKQIYRIKVLEEQLFKDHALKGKLLQDRGFESNLSTFIDSLEALEDIVEVRVPVRHQKETSGYLILTSNPAKIPVEVDRRQADGTITTQVLYWTVPSQPRFRLLH